MGGMGVKHHMNGIANFILANLIIFHEPFQWLCRCFDQDTVVAHVFWDVSCMENTWRNEGHSLGESEISIWVSWSVVPFGFRHVPFCLKKWEDPQ